MEWISVKDRLPEYGQKVVCYNAKFDMYRVVWLQKYMWEGYPNGYTQWAYDNTDCGFYTTFFDYWMPLPEPPKEDA